MLTMFRPQCCGEQVAFLAVCDICWVVGDKVILSQDLVYSVPPENKCGLGAFDSVGKTEEVVKDSCDLVDSGCRNTCPQVRLGC